MLPTSTVARANFEKKEVMAFRRLSAKKPGAIQKKKMFQPKVLPPIVAHTGPFTFFRRQSLGDMSSSSSEQPRRRSRLRTYTVAGVVSHLGYPLPREDFRLRCPDGLPRGVQLRDDVRPASL